jgi:3-deoxy-D-manno-octulosonic-acid transferase
MSDLAAGCLISLYSAAFELSRRAASSLVGAIGRRKGWDLDKRQNPPRVLRDHGSRTVVWVHAASLGEAKLLVQFLEMLETRNPDDCYVLTATSRSGVEYLERMKRPSVVAVGFMPLDTLPLMRSLLRHFAVSRLWLLETELWPSMLWACFTAGVPVGIANARVEEKSFVNYRRLGFLVRALLRRLDMVLAQNETYAGRWRALGVRADALHVVGNMKGYIRIRRPTSAERLPLRRALRLTDGDTVVVAGCLHAGEGAALRACLAALAAHGRACKCVVVPRYLEEAAAIAGELGGAAVRLSDAAAESDWGVCIVEKLGVLESMYRIADAAVVGGTFVDIGGHNLWEAARFGIPVFFGPYCHSQSSSCEKLLAAGVGFKAAGAEELAAGLERALWTEPQKFAAAAALFAEHSNQQQSVVGPLIP